MAAGLWPDIQIRYARSNRRPPAIFDQFSALLEGTDMLKSINPILSPELLYLLCGMGHRHELAIVDANFPCHRDGPSTVRLDGISAPDVLDAILSVLPLEKEEPEVAWRMLVDGHPANDLPIFSEFRQIIAKHEDSTLKLAALDPIEFKKRTRQAFALVVTGERRLYGCIIVKKGVIQPE
jgi:L-fucose mutarotase